MIALQPLKTVTGTMIEPGKVIQVEHPERLLSEGKARRLTRAESQDVLRRYVAEAREVFKAETPQICYICKSSDFWTSTRGVAVCRTCHPPMAGAEKEGT